MVYPRHIFLFLLPVLVACAQQPAPSRPMALIATGTSIPLPSPGVDTRIEEPRVTLHATGAESYSVRLYFMADRQKLILNAYTTADDGEKMQILPLQNGRMAQNETTPKQNDKPPADQAIKGAETEKPLFTLIYDGRKLQVTPEDSGRALPVNRIIADIMFCYWPSHNWTGHLPAGWTLVDNKGHRTVQDRNGNTILLIEYNIAGAERRPIRLENNALGYQIDIDPWGNSAMTP